MINYNRLMVTAICSISISMTRAGLFLRDRDSGLSLFLLFDSCWWSTLTYVALMTVTCTPVVVDSTLRPACSAYRCTRRSTRWCHTCFLSSMFIYIYWYINLPFVLNTYDAVVPYLTLWRIPVIGWLCCIQSTWYFLHWPPEHLTAASNRDWYSTTCSPSKRLVCYSPQNYCLLVLHSFASVCTDTIYWCYDSAKPVFNNCCKCRLFLVLGMTDDVLDDMLLILALLTFRIVDISCYVAVVATCSIYSWLLWYGGLTYSWYSYLPCDRPAIPVDDLSILSCLLFSPCR